MRLVNRETVTNFPLIENVLQRLQIYKKLRTKSARKALHKSPIFYQMTLSQTEILTELCTWDCQIQVEKT